MARPTNQSDNYNYNVESVKLMTPDGQESGWFANRRTDDQTVLGVCTEQYTNVQNKDLFGRADDIIEAHGLVPSRRSIVVSDHGAKVRGIYDFTDGLARTKGLIADVPQVGDEMGFRLMINNSFDRSLRVSFAMGLVRLVCTNGMVTIEKELELTKKHSKSIDITKLITSDKLEQALGKFKSSLDIYGRLAGVNIEQEQGLNILQRFAKQNVISEKLREGIARIWNDPTHDEDKGRNLYNLNNAVTQYLTSDVADERFEYSNRIGNQVLKSLARASKNKPAFTKLTSALPAEVVNN